MPRLKGFTNNQKIEHQKELIADRCDVLLYKNKISKSKVAEFVGITPQAIHNQFKTKSLSTGVIIAIITLTEADEEFVRDLLTIA